MENIQINAAEQIAETYRISSKLEPKTVFLELLIDTVWNFLITYQKNCYTSSSAFS